EIYEEKWSVSGKIEFVLATLQERGAVKFSELFEQAANRAEVVCTFLALLELIRLKQLACLQPEPFAEIEISKAVAPAATVGESVVPAETIAPAKTGEPSTAGDIPAGSEATQTAEPPADADAETEEEEMEDEFDDEDEDDDDDEDEDEEQDDGGDEDEADAEQKPR
ncbi:MAG TPA: segregation/condensation protein A, partial [Candidatus Binatia bacterium]|nr:segregation/condensation protein A [Candidatus Binatia bacterium]